MASVPTTTTIIKSVTLVPGESFTLPPGSTLIGSTSIGDLTSNCDIPDLEEIQCYVAIFAAGKDQNPSNPYAGDQAHIYGYVFNDVETPFVVPYDGGTFGQYDLVSMAAELKADVGGIIQTSIGSHFYALGGIFPIGFRGIMSYILIQTIPSVATALQLWQLATGIAENSEDTSVFSRIYFIPLADAIAAGYAELPTCPLGV